MSIHAVPRLPPGLAARPRLTMRLEGAAAVVVLHAPSGFGKTAALTQWANGADRSGLWFRAREGMSEPAAFVQEVSARSEEHTSELQSLMRISYAVFCLKKKKHNNINVNIKTTLHTPTRHT